MFLGKHEPMHADLKRRLFDDAPKMRAMVACVAQYLAHVLQIRNEEVDPKLPFVEVSRRELHYFLSLRDDGRFRQIESLHEMYDFVVCAEDLASRMRYASLDCAGENIDVTGFTAEQSYYMFNELVSDGIRRTTIEVGNMGHRLMVEIKGKAMEWLDELDHVLCDCCSLPYSEADGNNTLLRYVKQSLSFAIAERITLMSYKSIVDDCLSSRSLEELLNEVYQDSKMHASQSKKRDATLVKMLLTLAVYPSGEQTRELLEHSMADLRDLVGSPPSELKARRDLLRLEQLSRAFAPDLDLEVRVGMVQYWSDNTRYAANAAKDALKQILDWQPIDRVATIHSILARNNSASVCQDFMIPPMSFLYAPRCFACKQPACHRGLTAEAARAECLVRAVWELASRGIFAGGVVAADAVGPVALDAILMARMAATSITNQRDISKLGVKMFDFVRRLYDMEGDHVRELDQASCSLSNFSCQELETVFDTKNEGLVFLCDVLTARTRELMTYSPNKEYASFATEAIPVLLPLIYCRRNRVGIPCTMRSNAFLDMILTLPRVKKWQPTEGTLKLTLADLRDGHPSCRAVFDQLHDKGVVVKRSGSVEAKRKFVYSFDTMELWRLLTEYSAFSPR